MSDERDITGGENSTSTFTVHDNASEEGLAQETGTDQGNGADQNVRPRRSRRSIVIGAVSILIVVAATALIAAALIFHSQGGSWFIVKTPSMGTAAPVGTLVLTTPATSTELTVGDVIAFHPPTSPHEVYTHRIIDIGPNGAITTRGDINGATDPWQLTDTDLIGKAVTIAPGLGWLIRGLPIILLGIFLVFIATARMRNATRKSAYRISGIALAVSLAAFIVKPFTGVVIEQVTTVGGELGATIVSTGLLPIRVQALHGNFADLNSGEVGHLSVPASEHQEFYTVSTSLHLDFWGWALLGFICLLPLLWTMIVGLPPKQDQAKP